MKHIKAMITGLMFASLIHVPAVQAELAWVGCGISKKAYMSEIAKAFEKKEGIHITIDGGGATKGIRETAAGVADLGGSCRHLMLEDSEKGVKLHAIAWDALVAIVNPDNPVSDISHGDLRKVFSGEITNWKQLGGDDHKIDVFAREGKISGVGMMARELIFGNADADFKVTQEFESTGPLEKAVEKSKYSIGLDGVSSAKKSKVKILNLNGVDPSVQNISNGTYKLFRPLYIVTAVKMTPDVAKFIDYIKSPEGQAVIQSQGTVTLKEGSALWGPYRENMKNVTGQSKGVFE
ncbi:MAG: phosphate ABC transporter substrate-binding protein [SAR324 cluster bacterium]|nr:phosphate ABC transporter substrate-binding protein [SAR324 cluster bacterium]